MAASEKGDPEVVQALLQAGAAVNAGEPVGGVLSGLAIGVECGCLCVWSHMSAWRFLSGW